MTAQMGSRTWTVSTCSWKTTALPPALQIAFVRSTTFSSLAKVSGPARMATRRSSTPASSVWSNATLCLHMARFPTRMSIGLGEDLPAASRSLSTAKRRVVGADRVEATTVR
jgi:hypothetical protein